MPSLRAASRRQLTLFIAISGVLVAALAAVFVPVPYVILSPGPTLNTLGRGPAGRSLIQITGHPVYPTAGHLNLVTVSFQGGPSDSLNIFAALRAWLTPHEAVVPQAELFVPGQTQQQVVQQDTQQMTSSQQTATAAALCVLGIKFQVVDTVAVVAKGLPADGVLRRRDVITAVDGKPVKDARDLAKKIGAMPPKTSVKLAVLHKGSEKTIALTLGEMPASKEARADTSAPDSGADIAKLGLTLAPAARVAGAGSEGVVVTGVDSSGVAADHGFSTGDVILEVAGKSVSTPADVREMVNSARTEGKRSVLLRVKKGDNTRFVALPVGNG